MTDEIIVIECRHCKSKNRIYKVKAIYNTKQALCGSCSKHLFYQDSESFVKIDPASYSHPLDQSALEAVKKIPGTNTVLKFILRESYEKYYRLWHYQNFVKVSDKHIKHIYKYLEKAVKILDLNFMPELFVYQNPQPNAYTMGIEKSYVCISTSIIDLLDDEQLIGVIAHELGHIQNGHVLYKMAIRIINWAFSQLSRMTLGLGAVALLIPVYYALLYWDRCSELTADRAEMLVTKDFQLYVNTTMRLSSGSEKIMSYLDEEEFIKQGEEAYNIKEENFINKVFAEFQTMGVTHPFPIWRTGALKEWVFNEEYLDIIQGKFSKRDEYAPNFYRYYEKEVEDSDKAEKDSEKEETIFDTLKKLFGR